jgi:hypothetical protein
MVFQAFQRAPPTDGVARLHGTTQPAAAHEDVDVRSAPRTAAHTCMRVGSLSSLLDTVQWHTHAQHMMGHASTWQTHHGMRCSHMIMLAERDMLKKTMRGGAPRAESATPLRLHKRCSVA